MRCRMPEIYIFELTVLCHVQEVHLGRETEDESTEELEYPLQIVLEVACHSTHFSYQLICFAH